MTYLALLLAPSFLLTLTLIVAYVREQRRQRPKAYRMHITFQEHTEIFDLTPYEAQTLACLTREMIRSRRPDGRTADSIQTIAQASLN